MASFSVMAASERNMALGEEVRVLSRAVDALCSLGLTSLPHIRNIALWDGWKAVQCNLLS